MPQRIRLIVGENEPENFFEKKMTVLSTGVIILVSIVFLLVLNGKCHSVFLLRSAEIEILDADSKKCREDFTKTESSQKVKGGH